MGLLAIVVVLLLVLSFSPALSLVDAWNANPLLNRLTDYQSLDTVRVRLSLWKVGIKGFIESPILGWGPENYIAILGRYGPGEIIPTISGIYDHSHNKLIEELATKGVAGLLVHAAIWGVTFHIVLCAVRDMSSREQVPVLFAGAALIGLFVQSMFTLDMTVGSLQLILLLAFIVHLETTGGDSAPGQGDRVRQPASSFTGKFAWNKIVPRPSAAPQRSRQWPPFARLAGSRGARVSLAAGTIVLAGAGLFVKQGHLFERTSRQQRLHRCGGSGGLPRPNQEPFQTCDRRIPAACELPQTNSVPVRRGTLETSPRAEPRRGDAIACDGERRGRGGG